MENHVGDSLRTPSRLASLSSVADWKSCVHSSGVAQWLACWAHNSKVGGSKPLSASFMTSMHAGKNDDHGRTRTYNLRFRRPTPYPLGHAATVANRSSPSLEREMIVFCSDGISKKPMAGIEPTTSRLLSGCSTAKLHWLPSSGHDWDLNRK